MKKKSLVICFLLLIQPISPLVKSSEVEAVISDWKKMAARYNGELTDLSDASKTAIVLGNIDFAIKPYLVAYNGPLKEKLGVSSIYQVFLIYIDPVNKNRSIEKADFYLQILRKEWSDQKETIKAEQLYKELSKSG